MALYKPIFTCLTFLYPTPQTPSILPPGSTSIPRSNTLEKNLLPSSGNCTSYTCDTRPTKVWRRPEMTPSYSQCQKAPTQLVSFGTLWSPKARRPLSCTFELLLRMCRPPDQHRGSTAIKEGNMRALGRLHSPAKYENLISSIRAAINQ